MVTKDGVEIDLIVERRNLPDILIEIKSSIDPNRDDAKHLRLVKGDVPDSEAWLISRIERERVEEGVRYLNWQTAISELFSG